VEFKIDTLDSCPKKQLVRRISFAAREEVSAQLKDNNVIKPSESLWASPVVLVRKRENLNIFSTLDLKSRYWQIKVDPSCQEKTAFITHQGLFEFRVTPFGEMNAPAVFQHLF